MRIGGEDVVTAAAYEARYPSIPWRDPVPVTLPNGEGGYACRICVAELGLAGRDVAALPDDPAVVRAHIEQAH